jgi:hypothetical protein
MNHGEDYLPVTLEIRRAYAEWRRYAYGTESGEAEDHFDDWLSEIQNDAVKDYIYYTGVGKRRLVFTVKGES